MFSRYFKNMPSKKQCRLQAKRRSYGINLLNFDIPLEFLAYFSPLNVIIHVDYNYRASFEEAVIDCSSGRHIASETCKPEIVEITAARTVKPCLAD